MPLCESNIKRLRQCEATFQAQSLNRGVKSTLLDMSSKWYCRCAHTFSCAHQPLESPWSHVARFTHLDHELTCSLFAKPFESRALSYVAVSDPISNPPLSGIQEKHVPLDRDDNLHNRLE